MPQVTIRVTNAEVVRQGLENLSTALPKIGRKRLRGAADTVREMMAVPGSAVVYPVNWDSDQQMIAFFASDGFGGGIPYVRTDDYVNAWEVVPVGEIGYRVDNPSPYAKYVGGLQSGAQQSSIHMQRWQLFRDAIDQVRDALPEEVASHLRRFVKKGMEGWAGGDEGP